MAVLKPSTPQNNMVSDPNFFLMFKLAQYRIMTATNLADISKLCPGKFGQQPEMISSQIHLHISRWLLGPSINLSKKIDKDI
jgi:hypothetical protein